MDRYSKVYSSKWQSRYSEEFKKAVCAEFLNGGLGMRELENKYKLGNSRVSFWLKSYGYDIKKTYTSIPIMQKPTSDTPKSFEVSELEKQLEQARFEAEAYRKMIEVAERELKIEIRKKSGTKQ